MYVLSIVVCPLFCTFSLAIVLSVLLRYTVSDCPFCIFKLFFHIDANMNAYSSNGRQWNMYSCCVDNAQMKLWPNYMVKGTIRYGTLMHILVFENVLRKKVTSAKS